MGDQRADPVPIPHRQQHADSNHQTTHHEKPEPPALGLQLPVFKEIVLILKSAADVIGDASANAVVLGVGHDLQKPRVHRASLQMGLYSGGLNSPDAEGTHLSLRRRR